MITHILHKAIGTAAVLLCCASCAEQCNIQGNSKVASLDGKLLYINMFDAQNASVCVDSCEVIHGRFSFSPGVDSVVMVRLFTGGECIMPLVIEGGDLVVSVDHSGGRISGGVLNDRLDKFLQRRRRLDNRQWDLDQKCMRMMYEGKSPAEVKKAVGKQAEKLRREMDRLETQFIRDNYDNPLGPGMFVWLFSENPVPVMTPQIEEIVKDAPPAFLHHPEVSRYLRRAAAYRQIRMNVFPDDM